VDIGLRNAFRESRCASVNACKINSLVSGTDQDLPIRQSPQHWNSSIQQQLYGFYII
jgi:hypothetical protein